MMRGRIFGQIKRIVASTDLLAPAIRLALHASAWQKLRNEPGDSNSEGRVSCCRALASTDRDLYSQKSRSPCQYSGPTLTEVTRILSAIHQGDPQAATQLLPLVYDELRKLAAQKLAQEKPGQTLQATALVHEAYLRLVAGPGR